MKRGEDTLMPNWALDAMQGLTLATDIKTLMWLVRHRVYRSNTYSTKQLAIALEVDARTMRDCLERLRGLGLILSHDGAHCSADASSKLPASQVKAATQAWEKKTRANARAAQASCNAPASLLQKDPASETNAAVSDSKNSPLNKGSNEVMKKGIEDRDVEVVLGDSAAVQPSQSTQPQEQNQPSVSDLPEFGADAPAANAATDVPGVSSLEKDSPAGQKTETLTGGLSVAAARPAAGTVRQEHHGDDHEAVQLFNDIAGYGFVSRYRNDLARWHRDYSPEFLRLAYKLSGSLPGTKGIWTFADLLNRDPRREWPEQLQAQYQRDVQTSLKPAESETPRVQVGDLLRFTDGETVSVLRVDSATLVTDSDADGRGYVPFRLLGRGVEVLRS